MDGVTITYHNPLNFPCICSVQTTNAFLSALISTKTNASILQEMAPLSMPVLSDEDKESFNGDEGMS
jgi:hypothetical protein